MLAGISVAAVVIFIPESAGQHRRGRYHPPEKQTYLPNNRCTKKSIIAIFGADNIRSLGTIVSP